MYTLGVDIGSTTAKAVLLRDGAEPIASALAVGGLAGDGAGKVTAQVLAEAGIGREEVAAVVATGYGRARYTQADFAVSELTCHALGAHRIFPAARTVIDIGGQDAKVIALSAEGRMMNFLMNDKCAAGTGRFLEVMAGILGLTVDEMGPLAAQAEQPAAISGTCTVFAESEVISRLACGVERADLVAGICASVAVRTAALAKRVGIQDAVCMSGGVAQNEGVRAALSRAIGHEILVSPFAQYFGALGAARYGWQKASKKEPH